MWYVKEAEMDAVAGKTASVTLRVANPNREAGSSTFNTKFMRL